MDNATLEVRDVSAKGSHGGKRPGSGRPKTGSDNIPVKLDRNMVAQARFVAERLGMTLADYLNATFKPAIAKAFDKAVKDSKGDG